MPKAPTLYDLFKHADFLIPDGIGIVLAARMLQGVTMSRVTGVDLMKDICCLAARESKSIFLYGSKEAANKAAADKLKLEFPGLCIAGRSDGYVPESKMPELVGQINDSGASILFLALGSPGQEKWFASHAVKFKNLRVCHSMFKFFTWISKKKGWVWV